MERHLSCVGQIPEVAEEAEEEAPQFWGMGSPTVRLSPVRKRLPVVVVAARSTWGESPSEEDDDPLSSPNQDPSGLVRVGTRHTPTVSFTVPPYFSFLFLLPFNV